MTKDATGNNHPNCPKSRLFVFAHRGEAQAFIESGPSTSFTQDPVVKSLYQFKDGPLNTAWLLICGEGRQNATEQVMAFLSQKYLSISEVINLGVAANLSQLEKFCVYSVRTIYQDQEFSSYSTESGSYDLISVDSRVRSKEDRKAYIPYAHLLDREAWSVARCAKLFKLPFSCYKIVSDDASSTEVCQQVKESSQIYSQKLLEHYLKNKSDLERESLERNERLEEIEKNFYLTFSQEKQIENLLDSIKRKKIVFRLDLNKYQAMELLPKEKTKVLIEELREISSPEQLAVERKLDKLKSLFREKNIELKLDRKLEDKSIQVQFKVTSEEDLQIKRLALKNLPLKEISDIFEGRDDV